MRRGGQWWRIGAVLVLAYVVMYVVEPFTTTNAGAASLSIDAPTHELGGQSPVDRRVYVVRTRTVPIKCGAAIVDAWHAKSPNQGGWFAYAPLTNATVVVHGSCRNESRHRLAVSLVGVVIALMFVLGARWSDRRPPLGFGPTFGPAT